MGPAVATEVLLGALGRAGAAVIHVNTRDARPVVSNVGVLDRRNVVLALYHAAEFAWRAFRNPVQFAHVPISQVRWGYVRDAVFLTIARLLGVPTVVQLRGAELQSFFNSRTRLEKLLIRTTLAWASCAIALTPELRDVYRGFIPPERIRVLEEGIADPYPRGVDALAVERARRAATAPDRLRILFVANHIVVKGGLAVIRALSHPGLENATVQLVGAAPETMTGEAKALARALGVEDRVELAGELTGREKWRRFEWADVFAYPTQDDAQPLVVLEAMAAGLPVVASAHGGIPETLAGSGILIRPGDAGELATALRSVIERPHLRDVLGRAARERFLSNYTTEAFQARFERVLSELIELTS